jgi:hypothetical protein
MDIMLPMSIHKVDKDIRTLTIGKTETVLPNMFGRENKISLAFSFPMQDNIVFRIRYEEVNIKIST